MLRYYAFVMVRYDMKRDFFELFFVTNSKVVPKETEYAYFVSFGTSMSIEVICSR